MFKVGAARRSKASVTFVVRQASGRIKDVRASYAARSTICSQYVQNGGVYIWIRK